MDQSKVANKPLDIAFIDLEAVYVHCTLKNRLKLEKIGRCFDAIVSRT